MQTPTPIDLSTWPRRQLFDHYLRAVPCTYSVTVDIDVTAFVAALEERDRRTYPSQIWALTTVLNRHEEFRLVLDDTGSPAVWPVVHPRFTVFNRTTATFAAVWAEYNPSYADFHDAAAALIAEHASSAEMFPQREQPANCFDLSSLPWTSFTGFTLNIRDGWDHLAPILTLGRYRHQDGRVQLPLAVQVHHAAADGFHTGRLITEFQELVADPSWVR